MRFFLAILPFRLAAYSFYHMIQENMSHESIFSLPHASFFFGEEED